MHNCLKTHFEREWSTNWTSGRTEEAPPKNQCNSLKFSKGMFPYDAPYYYIGASAYKYIVTDCLYLNRNYIKHRHKTL